MKKRFPVSTACCCSRCRSRRSLGAYPVFVMKLMCFALFASAFNLLLGYTGLLSFGHAAFLGGSAYIAGQAIKDLGPDARTGPDRRHADRRLLGWIFGVLAIRRQGIYFAMITLALAQMVFFICLQAKFTGGEDGLQGVPRGKLFGLVDLQNDLTMYYVALAVVVSLPADRAHHPFALRPGAARASRRTSRARCRSATTCRASSCWPS
jgi:ABC-type branched-subunit amino acid transport system permease subunit